MHSCKYREIACYAGELGRLPGRTMMLPTGKKQCICKVIVDSLYISTPFSHQFHILNFCHLCCKYCFPSQYCNPCQEFWPPYFLGRGHFISRILSRMLMFSQPHPVFQSNLGTPRIPFQTLFQQGY